MVRQKQASMENASAVRYGCIVRLYSRVAARNAPYRRAFCLNSYKKHGPCGLWSAQTGMRTKGYDLRRTLSYLHMSTRRIILKRTESPTSEKRMPPHNKTYGSQLAARPVQYAHVYMLPSTCTPHAYNELAYPARFDRTIRCVVARDDRMPGLN